MMVVGTDVTKYGYYDIRALKPFCIDSREHPNPTYQMNVAFQEVDSVKLNKNKSISYFVPNNISYAPHDPTGRFNLNVRSSREAVS